MNPRLWIQLGVVVLWVAVMSLVWWRENGRVGSGLRRMGISPEVLLVTWSDYDQWLWIEQNERRIGVSHLAMRSIDEDPPEDKPEEVGRRSGYFLQSRTRVQFTTFGLAIPIEASMRVRMNPVFEMETLECILRLPGRQVLCQAFTEGQQLYYRVKMDGSGLLFPFPKPGGETQPTEAPETVEPGSKRPGAKDLCGRFTLKEPIMLSDAVTPILARSERFRRGRQWTTRAANPLGSDFDLTLHVEVQDREEVIINGHPITAWRVSEQMGSMESTAWYDPQGELLRQDLANGLRLVRADRQMIFSFDEQFRQPVAFPEMDRAWIKEHADPEMSDRPLADEPILKALQPLWSGL